MLSTQDVGAHTLSHLIVLELGLWLALGLVLGLGLTLTLTLTLTLGSYCNSLSLLGAIVYAPLLLRLNNQRWA